MFVAPVEKSVGLIQGQEPDSIQEWWVYLALLKLEIPFMYQFEVFGGRTRRGGLVVDFVVWIPMITPIMIQGEYWHPVDDALVINALHSYFGVQPILLSGEDLVSEEATYREVKRVIG